MKKKYIISVIAALTFLILSLIAYALIQRIAADRQRKDSKQLILEAEEKRKEAEEATRKAIEAQREDHEKSADSLKSKKAD